MVKTLFVNRKREKEFIRKKLKSGKAEMIVIYGRRRVGKTFLLENVLKDAIFFTADLSSPYQLMNRFFDQIKPYLGIPENARIDQWDAFFQALENVIKRGKKVIVFDEFQYIPQKSDDFLSIMQRWWDCCLSKTNVKLFLCGSYIGMMEKIALDVSSPLYGRRTAQYKVHPFDFFDAQLLLKNMDCADRVRAYSAIGGIPLYLVELSQYSRFEEAILEKMLTPGEFLVEEGRFLILEEFKKDPSNYLAIIRAVASGKTTPSEISNETGIEHRKLATYLSKLLGLGIIKRLLPISLKRPSRKPLYYIEDNYLGFYFRYINPNIDLIYRGRGNDVLNMIKKTLSMHVSFTFEKIAQQYIEKLFLPEKIGKWWDKDAEIDVVAIKEDELIVAECKWRNKKTGAKTLHDLQRKTAQLLKSLDGFKPRKITYMLFSKSGFESELEDYRALLVDLNKLCT